MEATQVPLTIANVHTVSESAAMTADIINAFHEAKGDTEAFNRSMEAMGWLGDKSTSFTGVRTTQTTKISKTTKSRGIEKKRRTVPLRRSPRLSSRA